MIVMPSNQSGRLTKWLAQRYPGKVGHLYSPGGQRGPYPFLPYALDNGCFTGFDEGAFWGLVEWAELSGTLPSWVVVPDVVGDRDGTLKRWPQYASWLKGRGHTLAVAVQDGMTPADVRSLVPQADVVFVGGTTAWKWATAPMWCREFPRVHVGRVNSPERLWRLEGLGAESCDGTGWMRGDRRQLLGLIQFIRGSRPARFRCMFTDNTESPTGT